MGVSVAMVWGEFGQDDHGDHDFRERKAAFVHRINRPAEDTVTVSVKPPLVTMM
jgi:hypothetical protein